MRRKIWEIFCQFPVLGLVKKVNEAVLDCRATQFCGSENFSVGSRMTQGPSGSFERCDRVQHSLRNRKIDIMTQLWQMMIIRMRDFFLWPWLDCYFPLLAKLAIDSPFEVPH